MDEELSLRLRSAGAVLIEGPKACGKTRTALQVAGSVHRLDADEMARRAAEVAPQQLFTTAPPIVLDEWQLFPHLWDLVRHEVDARNPERGQFVLTGSATPEDGVRRHSGAGRFAVLPMRPLSLFESGHSDGPVSLGALFDGADANAWDPGLTVPDLIERIVVGGWPGLLESDVEDAARSNRNYLAHIAHTDVPALGSPRNPDNVSRTIQALARSTGGEVAVTTLAKDVGTDRAVSREAVYGYLDALQRLRITDDVPAWAPHMRSRTPLRKQPKRFLVDPALAVAALRGGPRQLLADLNATGHFFECLAVRDLRAYSQPLDGEIHHWRDNNQHEVDLVLELADGRWAAFEVKLTQRDESVETAARQLLSFAEKVDTVKVGEPAFLAVLTGTGIGYRRTDGVQVIPIGALGP